MVFTKIKLGGEYVRYLTSVKYFLLFVNIINLPSEFLPRSRILLFAGRTGAVVGRLFLC